ncbi:unnamed protein product [Cuscuta campestris]|uniref:Uncharacterized protein n=1 Tax=Cuscuta campestris TaxID=132261 RepID=A0A484MM56_9ASTE|nr:unnamed protein product [Cuscuta campestris]
MVSSGGAQKWRPGDGGSTAKRMGLIFSDHLTISGMRTKYGNPLGRSEEAEQECQGKVFCIPSLKVVSVLSPPTKDPSPLSFLPFTRLKVLELRECDLSASAALGLPELRHTLKKLICHNSSDALRHVFASRIADIKASWKWNRLSIV